jgi:hypothetical protein
MCQDGANVPGILAGRDVVGRGVRGGDGGLPMAVLVAMIEPGDDDDWDDDEDDEDDDEEGDEHLNGDCDEDDDFDEEDEDDDDGQDGEGEGQGGQWNAAHINAAHTKSA